MAGPRAEPLVGDAIGHPGAGAGLRLVARPGGCPGDRRRAARCGGCPGTGGGLGTHDTSQPIEIVADRLTVEQAQGRAVFLGNVLAEQGEMLLRADRLIVYYALGDDGAAPDQAIRRIEVEGNVTIASTIETAVGDTGFYDVTGSRIELAGNVVLTREANVIRGDLLEIDVEQQVATMTSAPGRAPGERVRALFRPAPGGDG
jgi:lipopolysaccharide export system protein LptA